MIAKIKEGFDLAGLEKYGFQSKDYEEYWRYMNEDDYIWVNKGTRVVDFRSVWGGRLTKDMTAHTEKVFNRMKRDGIVEEIEEDTRSNIEKAEAFLKKLKSKTIVEC